MLDDYLMDQANDRDAGSLYSYARAFELKVNHDTKFNKKAMVFVTLGGNQQGFQGSQSSSRSGSPAGNDKHKCLCRRRTHFWKPYDCSSLKYSLTREMEESRRQPSEAEYKFMMKEIYNSKHKALRLDLVNNHKWKIYPNPATSTAADLSSSDNKGPSQKYLPTGRIIATIIDPFLVAKLVAMIINPDLVEQPEAPPEIDALALSMLVAAFTARKHPLSSCTLYDNCGALHVVNSESLLDPGTFTPSNWTDQIEVGTSSLVVKGRGTRTMYKALDFSSVTGVQGDLRDLELTNVAVVEGFHVNIISETILYSLGLWVCGYDTTIRIGEPKVSQVVKQMKRMANLTFFEYKALSTCFEIPHSPAGIVYPTLRRKITQHFRRSRDYAKPREDPAWKWYLRGFHMAGQGLVKLAENARNVKVSRLERIECTSCSISHMSKQINRAPPEGRSPRPFYRIAWDLFDYERGYDGSEWLLVIKDEYSGKLFAHTLMARNLVEVFGVLREFEAWVVRQFGLYICFMKHDGDRAVFSHKGPTEYENFTKEKGITIEKTPAYTKEPNWGAEKAGQEVIERSITAITHANLPENLWPEGTVAGCKLYNMSPTARHDWKSPNEFLQQWFRNYYRWFDPEIITRIT
jgi:hypothetical protein